MSNWAYTCCCGYGEICGCNPFYGGQVNYTATWTGSVTAGGSNCACWYSIYGPTGGGAATYGVVVDAETWSGTSVTLGWRSTNILVPNFCTLEGNVALSQLTANEYQFFNNNCTFNAAVPNTNINCSISVLPPFPSIGRNHWTATCGITGMLGVTFRNDTLNCHPNNANWYVLGTPTVPPAGCNDWYGIAQWSHSIGTFSIV